MCLVSHFRASGLPRFSRCWFLAQQPVVLVVVVEPRAGRDPLRLEPDDDLDAFGVGVIADRPQAAGESRLIDLPRAGLAPISVAGIPTGVHPPVVDLDPLFDVAVDEEFLTGFVGLGHFGVLVRAARRHLRGGQFAAGARQVVGQHPAPPEVLRPHQVAAVEHLHDQAACGFPRRDAVSD